jgi:hypothetical protein
MRLEITPGMRSMLSDIQSYTAKPGGADRSRTFILDHRTQGKSMSAVLGVRPNTGQSVRVNVPWPG